MTENQNNLCDIKDFKEKKGWKTFYYIGQKFYKVKRLR